MWFVVIFEIFTIFCKFLKAPCTRETLAKPFFLLFDFFLVVWHHWSLQRFILWKLGLILCLVACRYAEEMSCIKKNNAWRGTHWRAILHMTITQGMLCTFGNQTFWCHPTNQMECPWDFRYVWDYFWVDCPQRLGQSVLYRGASVPWAYIRGLDHHWNNQAI